MQTIYEKNLSVFKELNLSTKDVLLVPKKGLLKTRSEAKLHDYLYSAPMDTVTGQELTTKLIENQQNAIISRFLDFSERTNSFFENAYSDSKYSFWWAVGADYDKEYALINNLCNVLRLSLQDDEILVNICVDVAHGDTENIHEVYKKWSEFPYLNALMSGSIATGEAAYRCIESGCTHLRIGIGPGAACTTRLVTGVGVPQLSAVFEIYDFLNTHYKSLLEQTCLIADGGINSSGDIVKYLSAGADAVMLGKMLSYTEESAGWDLPDLFTAIKLKSRKKVKRFRGQASKEFQIQQYGEAKRVEGASSDFFNPKYSLQELLDELDSGIESAISYLGLTNSLDLNPQNVEFRKITQNSWSESNTNL